MTIRTRTAACLLVALAPLACAGTGRVDGLLSSGREKLTEGSPAEAQELFERAVALEDGSLRTRVWLLRAWMDQGRSNDTLDAIDELARAHPSAPELDYLYGMAFDRRATHLLASGVTDASVQLNFMDAATSLGRAVEVFPRRFDDAYLPLARARWYTHDLEGARAAAERAVEAYGDAPGAWLQLGRVAFSQFKVALDAGQEGEAWSDEAERHWRAALEAFARAEAGFGRPDDAGAQRDLADAATQRGHLFMWKTQRADAAEAYGQAIAWAPETVDYATLRGLLLLPVEEERREVHFHRALDEGTRRFAATFGPSDPRDATALWWLGWTHARLGQPADAEAAFVRSVAKDPELTSAWLHVAMARHAQADVDGALAAVLEGWDVDPAAMVAEVKSNLATHVARLAYLMDQAFQRGDLATCAVVAELCAEAEMTNAMHWANLGVFLRDEGVRRQEAGEAAEDAAELFERALVAFQRGLELAPEDPSLVNDVAVVLHYYLDRDLERALEMYEAANEGARAKLLDESLSEADRAFYTGVLEDSTENVRVLRALLAERGAAPAETR